MQGGQLGLVILLVVAIIAINGSSKRWQTFLLILLACAFGLGIGAWCWLAYGQYGSGWEPCGSPSYGLRNRSWRYPDFQEQQSEKGRTSLGHATTSLPSTNY